MPADKSPEVKFETTHAWREEHAENLVICCSDHRYQAHIDEFVRKGLGCDDFDRLALPGGPHFLLAASYLPKFEWAGRRWLRYLVQHHDTEQIICIAHEDCGWYRNLAIGPVTIPLLKNRQRGDLQRISAALKDMFPDIRVHLYYARPNPKGHVEFSEVT